MRAGFISILAMVAALAVGSPGTASADSLKSSDFLKWDQSSRDWYLRVSITMAASIAAQNTKGQARCIYDWYYKNGEVNLEKRDHILGVLKDYPDYAPQGVLIAVLQKACGTFSYTGG